MAVYHTNRLFYELKGYVDKLDRFQGSFWSGRVVPRTAPKELEIVIPKGTSTPNQRVVLENNVEYGKLKNIPVRIIEL